MTEHDTALRLRVGGKYNWRHQPGGRLTYMGVERYMGDGRNWHQFAKVDDPGVVWCEVLDGDLHLFEETKAATSLRPTPTPRRE